MASRTTLSWVAAAAVIMLATSLPAAAGTVSLAWDPVGDPDLAGYRVYYGLSSSLLDQSDDAGNATEFTVSGLADCTTWYLAVKAYDTADNESESFSNQISGWPRPVLGTANPPTAEQGRRLSVTITGTNFQSGATVDFLDPNIVVNSVIVNSCTELVADVSVGNSAAVGAHIIDVVNPDTTFGTGVGLFTVEAMVAPTVAGTSPADGASGVGTGVNPTLTFSEEMDAASITSSTVRLLDAADQPVTQAGASPSLSPDGLTATIVPASDLNLGATYRIHVVGGSSGVLDLASHGMAADYTQATGFETAQDTIPPVISSVQTGSVGSTTAEITWSTDDPADSQVFYRETGQTIYQQTQVDTALVTSHTMTLQGLQPSTVYEYHVRSADDAGNITLSSPDETFATLTNGLTYIRFETEGGDLTSPVQVSSSGDAFQGSYVDTPPGTPTGSAASPSGSATYGVNVPQDGTWYLWVRIYGVNASANSWFESIDGAARQTIGTTTNGGWEWVAGRAYTLTSGLHTLELGGHEARARADRVLITNDPDFVPTEQPSDDNTPPGAVTGFSATPTDGRNDLGWTNPVNGDFVQTVIRYRTDGRYPTSPQDGFLVVESFAAPGSVDAFSHAGLTNGTTYYYAAFAVDDDGNVSTTARVAATPTDNVPPGPVNNVRRTDTR